MHFADSTVWTEEDLRLTYLSQHSTSGDDKIDGFFVDDEISAGDGADSVYAYDGDDIIIGGKGDDYLEGLQGKDAYIFNVGDGADWIQEWSDPSEGDDKIVFGEGITPGIVTIDRAWDDFFSLDLTIGTNGDSIRVLNQFMDDWETVEQFVFEDTTVWTAADIKEMYLESKKTSGDDSIDGFFGNDVIDGGAGEDGLYGYEGDDRLIGGGGDDFLVGDQGDDEFVYADGDGFDWIADFEAGEDTDDLLEIDVSGFDTYGSIMAVASEWEGVTYIDFGGDAGIALAGVSLSSLHADDFRFV